MAGDAEAPFPLTGWKKHFNSYTMIGRRNLVLASWAIGGGLMYWATRGKKKSAPAVKEN